jgi:uncharacterized protein YbaA (DUF1428 family)
MNKTQTATQEITSHLEAFFYRVPKKNNEAMAKSMKKFVPWFQKNGVRIEYYMLGSRDVVEGCESFAKTLSAGEDEDIWMELQYYRDRKHGEDVFAKMMKDRDIEQLGKEFFGLLTPGTSLVTGGFGRLR